MPRLKSGARARLVRWPILPNPAVSRWLFWRLIGRGSCLQTLKSPLTSSFLWKVSIVKMERTEASPLGRTESSWQASVQSSGGCSMAPWRRQGMWFQWEGPLTRLSPPWSTMCRVAKCHGYGGYIRVRKLEGWGKKSGRKTVLQKQVLFWVNLSN